MSLGYYSLEIWEFWALWASMMSEQSTTSYGIGEKAVGAMHKRRVIEANAQVGGPSDTLRSKCSNPLNTPNSDPLGVLFGSSEQSQCCQVYRVSSQHLTP